MKKLKKVNASCAVAALWYIAGIDEEAVLRVCQMHGFKEGAGMADEEWQAAARQLGIDFAGVAMQPILLGKWLKTNKAGLFLMGTWDHLFVVDHGVIIDPQNPKSPGLKRTIRQIWRVKK